MLVITLFPPGGSIRGGQLCRLPVGYCEEPGTLFIQMYKLVFFSEKVLLSGIFQLLWAFNDITLTYKIL